jgi:aldehyde dehydrogenase (NAD+)
VGAIVAMATAFRVGAQLLLQYYSGAILDVPATEEITGLVSDATVRRVPLGVAAAVLPWNAPLTTALYTVAPALAAGCTVVVKSPVEAPLATYVLGDIASESGLPDGVLNVVCANNDVSEALVRHPGVDKVCFTGSTAVGRRIASICGERLVSATLELGGKSAAIILDDADPGPVAAQVAPLTMLNSGQACTNATRVLVPRRRRDEFVEALAAAIAQFRVGDPFDPQSSSGL